jgi:RNA polymerase sigma factor (sigma-70 family)
MHGPSDAELIDSVRRGTVSAYGSLYERHVGAAYNLARAMTRSQAEVDDLVSEAFAKVLDTLRAGRGPDSAFRAYLLTSLRHTAYDKTRRDRKVELSDDVTAVAGAETAVPFSDTAVAGLERSLAARAFARLPERWQAVLWHTEVEGQSPAEVAPLLGLTSNGVSALAYRAREGLRQAYLQVHLAESDNERCRATAERLGAWTRSGLSRRETAQVEAHLDDCVRCRALAAELADVNGGMRGVVAPLVLGGGTLGYMAATGAKAGSAAVAGVAAGSAAGAGAAGGAASSLPRQLIGVAVSATALAVAVALALSAGTETQVPAAQQPTRPAVSAPAPVHSPNPPNPPNPPQPPQPPQPSVPPPPPPQPTPNQPAPSPGPSLAPAPAPPPSNPAPAPGQPAPPSLSTPMPSALTLIPGSDPADLPITVSNNGGSVSEPVMASLTLPPGVTAVASLRLASPPLLRLNAAAPGPTVSCPGGTGTVTCTNGRGLQPNESVTLLFRVIASEDSPGGEITGSVNAGASVSVRLSVKVEVRPVPKKDGVAVYAYPDWLSIAAPGLGHAPSVQVVAKNSGESTKKVTVTFDEDATLASALPAASCTSNGATTSCVTDTPLKPGDRFYLRVKLRNWGDGDQDRNDPQRRHSRKVHVTATLGTASASTVVRLPWWSWPVPPREPKPPTTRPTVPGTPKPTDPASTPVTPKPTGPVNPAPPPANPPASDPPPVKTTTPPMTRTSEPPPPRNPCDTMSADEKTLAALTGRCPTPDGPAPG